MTSACWTAWRSVCVSRSVAGSSDLCFQALQSPDSVPQFAGWQFVLWHQFSDESKKSHWFSVCSFFFLVRTGAATSKLFHLGAEIRVLLSFLKDSFSRYKMIIFLVSSSHMLLCFVFQFTNLCFCGVLALVHPIKCIFNINFYLHKCALDLFCVFHVFIGMLGTFFSYWNILDTFIIIVLTSIAALPNIFKFWVPTDWFSPAYWPSLSAL